MAQALEEVGLAPEIGNRPIRKLSRGMLQRLGLAQLLIGKPQLCFLDEPTSGMDPLGMALVRDLLLRWRQEGKTVVINSHHLDQVEKVCDRVAFIQGGKIASVEELRPTEQTKLIFVVRWGSLPPASEAINAIAKDMSIECESSMSSHARFLLTSKTQSTQLLRALIAANVEVEEALYERIDLVELFKNEAFKGKQNTADIDDKKQGTK